MCPSVHVYSVPKEMASPLICKDETILGIVCAHVHGHGATILGIYSLAAAKSYNIIIV